MAAVDVGSADDDYDFFEPLPEELTCPICLKVLSEPHLVNCCEGCFCKGCLDRWSQNSNTCPHCRSTDFSHIHLKQKSRKIRELKVYCPNKKHGCECVLKIGECRAHLLTISSKGCSYVMLSCPNNCKAKMFRKDIEIHKDTLCPKRFVSCIHCGLFEKYLYIFGDHINKCPRHPLPCPQGCEQIVVREDLAAHRSICPFKPVFCPFSEFGCKTLIPRKDLEKHIETNMLHHMTTLAKSHAMLKEEHVKLQADHKALKKDHIALKQSHTAKLKAITPLLKDHPLIYTILAESSSVTLGEELKLALSESNKKSGHHYIILAEPGHLEYKFKLEWKTPGALTSQKSHRFLLYTEISGIRPVINVIVNLSFDNGWPESPHLDDPKCIAEICCGNPLKEVSVSESVDKSLRLLGKLDLASHKSDQHLCIRFVRHEEKGCLCTNLFCMCHFCFGKKFTSMSQLSGSKPLASVSRQPFATVSQQPASMLQPPANSVSQPPASMLQPPTSVSQPPASVLQPPANSVSQPPASVLQPPTSVSQPPASVSLPPASMLHPPASVSQPPASMSQSPVSQPPASVLQPPANSVSEPPASMLQPPASLSEPPASMLHPPASVSQPMVSISQPPTSVLQLPASVPQQPVSISQPPASVLQPPTSVPQPPASVSLTPASMLQSPPSVSQPFIFSSNQPFVTSGSAFGSKPLTMAPVGPSLQFNWTTLGVQPSTNRRVARGRRKK